MRVIEARHIHEKEAFCTHCGSMLGYYPADVNIDTSWWIEIYIKCPVCGHKIIFHTFSTDSIEKYWEWKEKVFTKWKDGI